MSPAYSGGEHLAEVVRSEFVESRHHGSVVVLGPDAEAVAWAGDITGAIFPRSTLKPLQAVGMLRAGLELTDPADLALVCASHHGEPAHVNRVRAMLARGGLTEADLRTPPEYPLDEQARLAVIQGGGGPEPIQMNCSGKHAGMLLTCLANGWPLSDYTDPRHPLQRALRATVEELVRETAAAVGVDGCGAPVLATSLAGLAAAFLRLVGADAAPDQRRVADAMRAHPELVAGTRADDTALMRVLPGLVCKGGAEGVHVAAITGVGAVALKVDDGAMRPRLPVLVSALRRLGVDLPAVTELAFVPVFGGGIPVGRTRTIW